MESKLLVFGGWQETFAETMYRSEMDEKLEQSILILEINLFFVHEKDSDRRKTPLIPTDPVLIDSASDLRRRPNSEHKENNYFDGVVNIAFIIG